MRFQSSVSLNGARVVSLRPCLVPWSRRKSSVGNPAFLADELSCSPPQMHRLVMAQWSDFADSTREARAHACLKAEGSFKNKSVV